MFAARRFVQLGKEAEQGCAAIDSVCDEAALRAREIQR
jgi:hypothetical protein